jgi:hypothetical protein
VILWRLLPWQPRAAPDERGGALWFPRELQGAGRHDNPDRSGCLYVAEKPLSVVAEALAPCRGAGPLVEAMLARTDRPLALVQLELDGDNDLLDLDEPRVLMRTRLRPSQVATNARGVTQAHALRLFNEHSEAGGLRWWSALEASLINVTLFDRVASRLVLRDSEVLALDHPAVLAAAEMLGLAPGQ